MKGFTSRLQRGLTLLEILIAMSLGAFMLVGIVSLMASVSSTRTELSRTSELIENGRYAIQILSDEISLAGYFGPYFNAAVTREEPDPCENGATLTAYGIDDSVSAPKFPPAVQGFGYTATKAIPSCFSTSEASLITNGEILTIHRVDTSSIAASAATNNRPYLQYSGCDADSKDFEFTNSTTDLTLRDEDCNIAVVWPYRVSSFFVSSCDQCSSGDTVPTLKVVEYVDGTRTTHSLVEGIEDIHFEYGIDLDDNGAPDCYVADPRVDDLTTVGCPVAAPVDKEGDVVGSANYDPALYGSDAYYSANVVSIQVAVLVRSLENFAGWDDNKKYDLGGGVVVGPFNDAYKRRVFRTAVLIQNVSGERE